MFVCAFVIANSALLPEAVRFVPATDVKLTDTFWAPRIERNLKVTIPHGIKECYDTGRMRNFEAAIGKADKFEGYYFNDSDVYKTIQGAALALEIQRDSELEAKVDAMVETIAAAQEPDGYIYTAKSVQKFGLQTPSNGPHWSNIRDQHELYCMGHLMEAGVAYKKATGKRKLFDVAKRAADLICATFGKGKIEHPSGHEEVEIGLVAMYDATGDVKYLNEAAWLFSKRGDPSGRGGVWGDYAQDHIPLLSQDKAVGHSVRAAYCYTGMGDVALRQEAPGYMHMLTKVWQNVADAKLYLTGGIGASGSNEGFTHDFDLPNTTAYQETCAVIANMFWNERMYQATGDTKYLDIYERALYNGFLSGIGLDGKTFFYPNRLTSFRGEQRTPWFGCACCPPNVMRVFPTIPGRIYSFYNQGIGVNLFAANKASIALPRGRVGVNMATQYPWDGKVSIKLSLAKPTKFPLSLRIPGWSVNQPVPSKLYTYNNPSNRMPMLKVNGKRMGLTVHNGYATLDREWKDSDLVELELPMDPKFVVCDPQVKDNIGRVAVERGPIVYCAEFPDQEDGNVLATVLEPNAKLTPIRMPKLLDGVTVLEGRASTVTRGNSNALNVKINDRKLRLIPYGTWANRGKGQMSVWLAARPDTALPAPAPNLLTASKVTTSAGWGGDMMVEQLLPTASGDETYPFFHWWPRKGSEEWVQIDFPRQATISQVEAYWFDDTGRGECKIPASWSLEHKTAEGWMPLATTGVPEVKLDSWCLARFKPVETGGLRLKVQMQKGWAAGIHEIRIK